MSFKTGLPTSGRSEAGSSEAAPAKSALTETAGCAAICRQLAEPLIGTAPTAAVGWLLIEHPGPWPAFGLPPDIPAPLARFANQALEHGVRTQLIRRPDRMGRQVGAGTPIVMVGGGPPGRKWLEQRALTDPHLLSGLDPSRIAHSQPLGFGVPVDAALLVCTHGRREVCCARFGRPVARALAARFGSVVWETTHVGGDRFAANLVVLPTGAYYGRLDPGSAVTVAEMALEGRITLDQFRGCAGLPAAVQAAECLLRRALGAVAASAVRYIDQRDDDDDDDHYAHALAAAADGKSARAAYRVHRVRFDVNGQGTHTVTLARQDTTCPRLTSCGTGTVETPTGYRLLGIAGPLADPAGRREAVRIAG